MVRFIMLNPACCKFCQNEFTFHYGQIYYANFRNSYGSAYQIYIPLWLDLLFVSAIGVKIYDYLFTFHYGQIYYIIVIYMNYSKREIYIPLWLDLLQIYLIDVANNDKDLHSTMVRFIIEDFIAFQKSKNLFTFHYGQIYYKSEAITEKLILKIYIPLWLDLLFQIIK